MSFVAKLQRAREVLAQQKRLSVRALAREIDMSGDELVELVTELVEMQQVARRDGPVLVWVDLPSTLPVQALPVSPVREPLGYTPKHLADKILQSKSALEGERKQVTVVFADVKGSMELAEQLDPEAWHRILERFFEILTEAVHRFEGTVNQYTGDGIMALFGAPIAHEDHAQRACYAALAMREALREFARDIKRRDGLDFATRIGINSGEVVVAAIGDDLRMDYTAQGHTVGLAQRMEGLAAGGAIYLSEQTAKLVRLYFELQDLGEFALKGVAEPIRVFELTGMGESRTRFDIARARGLSRFVGRASDLRTLEDALAQAAAGNGQVVGVVAEAGTGKSRLCFEFLEHCRSRDIRVFAGRAVAHGRNIPLLPILELFRAYFGITLQDDDRSAREKIAGRMALLDRKLAETLPLLFDFLGVADPQHPAPRLDPAGRQRQLMALMRQVIQSTAEGQPTVTFIEDLHWIDAASAEFLDHMVDAQAGSHRLLLVNFRPEYHAEWMQKSWYRQVPLTPLGLQATAELLADLLGHDPSIAGLTEPVHARTGGNPFFIEEVAQSLIESRQLLGTSGAYRLVTPVERLEVPATVQALLASRIDRLPEREKRLLHVAAVIGKDFAEPLLAAVADLPPDGLKAALAVLRRAEFIHEQALYPVAEYSFKHPLTQEVAFGSQLKERRRQVHAAVATAIELQDADYLDERAALLAHHWEEAGDLLCAARWHRRAAEWIGRTDFTAALRHWERVRALLRKLPEDNLEAARLGIAASTQLMSLSWRVGTGLDDGREFLNEGQALASVIGDKRAHLTLSIAYSRTLCSRGDVAAYVELAIENRRVALEIDDTALHANAWFFLIDALGHAGRLTEARELAEEGLVRFPRLLSREEQIAGINPHSIFSAWRGHCLYWQGQISDGLEELDRGRRAAVGDDTPEVVAWTLMGIAEACYLANDKAPALASAQQLEEITRRLGDPPLMTGLTQMSYGYGHFAAGRPADAAEAARSALDIFSRVEIEFTGMAATLLAESLLAAGDFAAAEAAAREAITSSRRSVQGMYEAIAQGVLARTLLRRDGPAARDAAEIAFGVASQLIDRTGARALVPALCEWRTELAAVLGDEVTYEQLLRQAEQGYQEIGAPKHAQRLAVRREAHDA